MGRRPNTEARACILKTALRLFYEGGFKGVSMDQVAQAVGIKKANLFHYYRSKDALGLAVFDLAGERHRCQIADRFQKDSKEPVQTIRTMFEETAEFMEGRGCCSGCFIGNIAQELSDHNEKIRRKIADHFKFWTDQVASFLARAKTNGYFGKKLQPNVAAQSLLSLYEGAILTSKAEKKMEPLLNAGLMAETYLNSFRA